VNIEKYIEKNAGTGIPDSDKYAELIVFYGQKVFKGFFTYQTHR
jgi:hypothetical protein